MQDNLQQCQFVSPADASLALGVGKHFVAKETNVPYIVVLKFIGSDVAHQIDAAFALAV